MNVSKREPTARSELTPLGRSTLFPWRAWLREVLPSKEGWPGSLVERLRSQARFVRLEEYRDGDDLVFLAELPGVDPARDVEVSVHGRTLRIRADRRHLAPTPRTREYSSEFRYGAFLRTVTLPRPVRQEDVSATYRDGILEIRVRMEPRPAEARHIRVSSDT